MENLLEIRAQVVAKPNLPNISGNVEFNSSLVSNISCWMHTSYIYHMDYMILCGNNLWPGD